jgi:four helix bundle protein
LAIGDRRAEIATFAFLFETSRQNGPAFAGTRNALCARMNPKAVELQARTQRFATVVSRFCEALPKNPAAQQIAQQLVDSAGSTDSNYRATCRARSPNEFIAKIGVAAEEADESKGWLQLLVASNFATIDDARALIQEADELTAIFVSSRKTAQRRKGEKDRLQRQLKEATRNRRGK